MKKFLLLIVLPLLMSCNQNVKQPEVKKYKIQNFIEKIVKDNPKRDFNSVYRSSFDSLFEKKVKIELQNNILDDVPLRLYSIKEISKNVYSAHFNFDNLAVWDESEFLRNLNVDVIALTDKETILKMEQGKNYFVKGDFEKFLSDDYGFYTNGLAYSCNFKINSEQYREDEYSLGILLLKNSIFKKE